ncbi:MAG TPA: hypothetical protein ACFYD0_14310, partial [Candidatus Wunengus sp. YC65]|uniref:hypothetical protein n=1 Tax=Candidatus Wunengus sp. YC65 TaxID=3367701 RepID=UPI0040264274
MVYRQVGQSVFQIMDFGLFIKALQVILVFRNGKDASLNLSFQIYFVNLKQAVRECSIQFFLVFSQK